MQLNPALSPPLIFRGAARALLLCGLFSLYACTTLGPDYQRPEAQWLDAWQPAPWETSADAGRQGELDWRFWWRLFNDPALDQLMAAAKTSSPTLRIAGLRILESRALLGIAGSALYPQQQQASGAFSYVHSEQQGGVLGGRSQDLASYQAGFAFGWEIDFWGRFKRGVESADAAFFASVANQQNAQVLLGAQIAELYFTYRLTQQRIAIAHENAAIQQRSYEITQRIFDSGGGSELDLQQAKTQYLATLSTIPQLEITQRNARNALCVLLGRPPTALAELAGAVPKLPQAMVSRLPELPARLLLRRPDVRAAAWQAAAQSAQIGIAEADFYPAISLLGSLAWSGNSLSGSANTASLGIGPALRWNLFDHGRIANNVRVQDARLQQAIESYQETLRQAAREIDDAAINVLKSAEQQVLLEQTMIAARRALELANTRYREGYANFQRVLDAQRSLFSQAERQLLAHGSHISAVISLYKSLGGGWQPTPAAQWIPAPTQRAMQQRTDWGDILTAPVSAVPAPSPSPIRAMPHE
jgi:NodT family efflux transporter outer membrane factor (OMF) lipoprotein